MPRSLDERLADVRRLIEATRELVETRAELAPALALSTGLSPEGVELALTRHLETDATDDDLRALVARAGDAPRVTVILAANVFVGALRAVALARAAAPRVVVRPSRRDPAFARALVKRAADPGITLDESVQVACVAEGEIHVYGHDETIAKVRAQARVPVIGHGSGLGVAWVSAAADLEGAAERLADDVVAFDQRGCLSPRLGLVEGSLKRANAFADALHAALEPRGRAVPRGTLSSQDRAASERYVATMTYGCRSLVGSAHVVGVSPPGAPLVPIPTQRHVHVVPCASETEALALVQGLGKAVIAVGSDDLRSAERIAPRWARISMLGEMQRPRLDGPVDLRGRI